MFVLLFCHKSDNFGVLESEHWSFILTSAAVFPCQRIEASLEIKAKKSSLEIKKKTVHHYGAGRGELKKSFIKNDDSFLLTFQVAPRFPVYIVHYTTGCLKSQFFESGTYIYYSHLSNFLITPAKDICSDHQQWGTVLRKEVNCFGYTCNVMFENLSLNEF